MKKWFFAILVVMGAQLAAQDGSALLKQMDDVLFAPADMTGTIQIVMIDKNGKEKVREAEIFQKGTKHKLYRYTKPENQAGIATLSLPGNIMWLYMPTFGKPKKISILAKTGAFNGTDFSYEDMSNTPYSEYYSADFVKKEGGQNLIELKPKDKSQYSKLYVYQNPETGHPVRIEFFDRNGEKFKEAVYQYEKVGAYWNAKEVTMTNIKKSHSTKIILSDIQFDVGLKDDIFKVESLGNDSR